MDKKPHIAIIKHDISNAGGSERVAVNMANELANFYQVSLISMQMKGNKLHFDVDSRVHVAALCQGSHRLGALYLFMTAKVPKQIRRTKFSAIICLGPETILFPLFLKKENRGKVIFSEQSLMANAFLNTWKVAFLRKCAVRCSDAVTVLSVDDGNAYKKKYSKYADKITILYNWIDDKINLEFAPVYNKQSKAIVSVGRISPVKNYEDLITAAKIIFKEKSDWHWDIYGSEEAKYGALIRRKINENGLNDYITLKGHKKEIYDLYGAYSFLVHTARTEGFGLVLIEAQARGLPVIAYRGAGGVKEIVLNEVNGYLVKDGDSKAMAEKILKLINSSELRETFSQHAKDGLEKFDKQRIVKRWIELIER